VRVTLKVMKVGDHVAWNWAAGIAEGTIESVSPGRTEITTKGKVIIRNGSVENPALIIIHISGTKVLKLMSEVKKVS
jgi:hypothetical protein